MTLRNTKLIGIASIVLILAISYFLVLSPLINSREELTTEVNNSTQELQDLQQRAEQSNQALTKYDENVQRDQLLNFAIPTAQESNNINAQIASAGSEVGILTNDVNIAIEPATIDEKSGQLLATSKISIGANGSPEQLATFVKLLNEAPRAITFNDISISQNEETYVLTASGSVFVYAPIQMPPSPGEQPINPNDQPNPPPVLENSPENG